MRVRIVYPVFFLFFPASEPEAQRGIYGLSAACMLLCAALTQAAGTVVGPGQPEAWGAFGAMLLREDAGGYVLVAVISFAAAAAITALCFRLRKRENQKKDGADKPNQYEQEGTIS